jgi:hypothetical protein
VALDIDNEVHRVTTLTKNVAEKLLRIGPAPDGLYRESNGNLGAYKYTLAEVERAARG